MVGTLRFAHAAACHHCASAIALGARSRDLLALSTLQTDAICRFNPGVDIPA
jgi:hypothetical protein